MKLKDGDEGVSDFNQFLVSTCFKCYLLKQVWDFVRRFDYFDSISFNTQPFEHLIFIQTELNMGEFSEYSADWAFKTKTWNKRLLFQFQSQ